MQIISSYGVELRKQNIPDPPDTGDLPFCCQLSDWDLCAGMGKISRNPGCKEAF